MLEGIRTPSTAIQVFKLDLNLKIEGYYQFLAGSSF
jgi:hypothetical protein